MDRVARRTLALLELLIATCNKVQFGVILSNRQQELGGRTGNSINH